MARVLVVGSSNTDLAVRLPRLPAPGQTVLGGSLQNGPGGKGANQAVAAARAGAEVVFVTAVGDDEFGRLALEGYRREGIDVSHARRLPETSSGVALIFVGDDGENMIGVAPGANARLTAEDIDGLPADLFDPGAVLLIAGLEVPAEAVAAAVRRGSGAGMTVVLNPAPAVSLPALKGCLAGVDVITPNRGELGLLTGLETHDGNALQAAATALRRCGPRCVVVTLGSAGCLVVDGDSARRIPPHDVRAVDTVAAGDAFSGTLAVALAEGMALHDAAVWANAAAALAVTRAGAQAALPTRAAIDRLVRSVGHRS